MKCFIFNWRKRCDIFDMNFKDHCTNICRHEHFHLLVWPLQRTPAKSALEWGTHLYDYTVA